MVTTPVCGICRRAEYSGGKCPVANECKREPCLNLGCGIAPKSEYINLDAKVYRGIQGWDKHLQTDIVMMIEDVVEKLPNGYFAEVLSAHVIEHFFYEDALEFLKWQHTLLRSSGRIIVEGPCILGVYRWYQEGREGKGNIAWLIEALYPYRNRVAPEYGPLMQHKSGWTGAVLAGELKKVGFKVVHIGEGRLHGHAWRDFRVEGVKL